MQKAFYPLLAFVLAALLYVPPLRDLPFSSRGEAREALVVQAMVEQQNLILPRRNGETIPSKPPFFHWAALAGLALDSSPGAANAQSEFGIRLPSAVAGALAIAILFAFTAARLGTPAAAVSAVVLGTSVEWARSSSIARVDMMFALWVMAGLLALFALIDGYGKFGEVSRKNLLLVSLCLAAATLTKGPAGVAIPWAIGGLYFSATQPIKRLPVIPGLVSVLVTVVLAALWYYPAYLQGGSDFLDVHLMRENLARVVGMDEYDTGHEAPAYAILTLLLTGLLPWSIFVPAVSLAVWRRRKILNSEEDAAVLFMGIWVVFFLVFFGATASKRSVYLLPCYPACAYLIAWLLFTPGARSDSGRAMRVAAWLAVVAASLLTFAVLLLALVEATAGVKLPMETLAQVGIKLKPHVIVQIELILQTLHSSPLILAGLFAAAAGAGFAARRLLRGEMVGGTYTFAASAAVLLVLINTALFPPIARAISPKPFMAKVTASIGDHKLYQFHTEDFHAATFYAGRVVERISDISDLTNHLSGYILAPKARVAEILARLPEASVVAESEAYDVYGKDRFVLIDARDVHD